MKDIHIGYYMSKWVKLTKKPENGQGTGMSLTIGRQYKVCGVGFFDFTDAEKVDASKFPSELIHTSKITIHNYVN